MRCLLLLLLLLFLLVSGEQEYFVAESEAEGGLIPVDEATAEQLQAKAEAQVIAEDLPAVAPQVMQGPPVITDQDVFPVEPTMQVPEPEPIITTIDQPTPGVPGGYYPIGNLANINMGSPEITASNATGRYPYSDL